MIRPTNPPIHETKHSPMGGGVSTDFKSLNRIEISQFVKFLLHFYWFGGIHNLVDEWVWGWVGQPIGGGVSTNHNSLNRIQLSQLDDNLLDF